MLQKIAWVLLALARCIDMGHTGSASQFRAEPAYFGSECGITHYNFASEQLHGLL